MKKNLKQGKYIEHISCNKCTSSDGLAVYTPGDDTYNGFCYVCQQYDPNPYGNNKNNKVERTDTLQEFESVDSILEYPVRELTTRGIRAEIAERYGVHCGINTTTGETIEHFYPYYSGSELTGWKVRILPKKFASSIGDIKSPDFFGQHLCGTGGKMLVITEGECDAMATYQMFQDKGKNYRVCSLPTGANIKAIKQHIEWLESFDTIILCPDQDEPGKKVAQQISDILTPGKVKIMSFSEKDPNAMLLANKGNEFFKSLFDAAVVRPDGIVSGKDTWERLQARPTVLSMAFPPHWEIMNQKTYGMRLGEIDAWTSGTGMGKSQLIRELEYHLLHTTDDNIGIIALEEPLEDSVEELMSLHLNKRILLPDVRDTITEEERYEAWQATSGTDRIHFYDHFGSVDDESLVSKIRYLSRGLDCKYIFLDHLSIVVSEFAAQGGERERIDTIMTRLKKLTQELGIWIGLIIHLRKNIGGGKSFEEGAVPTLDDLRGSGSLKQLSNNVYALSRDQQAKNDINRNTSQLHVLKCRLTGRTGDADYLYFDDKTGRMVAGDDPNTIEEVEF